MEERWSRIGNELVMHPGLSFPQMEFGTHVTKMTSGPAAQTLGINLFSMHIRGLPSTGASTRHGGRIIWR